MLKDFKTPFKKPARITNFLVDVSNVSFGRASSAIANLLMGKLSAQYAKQFVSECYVYVKNVNALVLTGNKGREKVYRHSLYIGGLRGQERSKMSKDRLLSQAVSGMLPKNRLRKRLLKRLKFLSGDNLPPNIKSFREVTIS
ncbi:MAG: uL13 family ribosomal protein [Deltaproteobacteria bacterium]|nr:uL13 family ribosomal protein [Deltaproteobacteria bacterium]